MIYFKSNYDNICQELYNITYSYCFQSQKYTLRRTHARGCGVWWRKSLLVISQNIWKCLPHRPHSLPLWQPCLWDVVPVPSLQQRRVNIRYISTWLWLGDPAIRFPRIRWMGDSQQHVICHFEVSRRGRDSCVFSTPISAAGIGGQPPLWLILLHDHIIVCGFERHDFTCIPFPTTPPWPTCHR